MENCRGILYAYQQENQLISLKGCHPVMWKQHLVTLVYDCPSTGSVADRWTLQAPVLLPASSMYCICCIYVLLSWKTNNWKSSGLFKRTNFIFLFRSKICIVIMLLQSWQQILPNLKTELAKKCITQTDIRPETLQCQVLPELLDRECFKWPKLMGQMCAIITQIKVV